VGVGDGTARVCWVDLVGAGDGVGGMAMVNGAGAVFGEEVGGMGVVEGAEAGVGTENAVVAGSWVEGAGMGVGV